MLSNNVYIILVANILRNNRKLNKWLVDYAFASGYVVRIISTGSPCFVIAGRFRNTVGGLVNHAVCLRNEVIRAKQLCRYEISRRNDTFGFVLQHAVVKHCGDCVIIRQSLSGNGGKDITFMATFERITRRNCTPVKTNRLIAIIQIIYARMLSNTGGDFRRIVYH